MPEPIDDPLREAGEAISATIRTGAMAAGQIMHVKLTRQAHADRQVAQAAQAEAHAATRRLQVERTTAAALYGPTRYSTWWHSATPDAVVNAWDAAVAFQGADPAATRALHDLRQGLQAHGDLARDLLASHPESAAAEILLSGDATDAGATTTDSASDSASEAGLASEPVASEPALVPEPVQAGAVAGLVAPSFPAGFSGERLRLASAGGELQDPSGIGESPASVAHAVSASFPDDAEAVPGRAGAQERRQQETLHRVEHQRGNAPRQGTASPEDSPTTPQPSKPVPDADRELPDGLDLIDREMERQEALEDAEWDQIADVFDEQFWAHGPSPEQVVDAFGAASLAEADLGGAISALDRIHEELQARPALLADIHTSFPGSALAQPDAFENAKAVVASRVPPKAPLDFDPVERLTAITATWTDAIQTAHDAGNTSEAERLRHLWAEIEPRLRRGWDLDPTSGPQPGLIAEENARALTTGTAPWQVHSGAGQDLPLPAPIPLPTAGLQR